MIFRITQLGEPVLRKVGKPVKLPPKELAALAKNMILTMRKAQGVGIAAPQVGKSLRLFIVAPESSVRYPKSPDNIPPVAMINPVLVRASKKMVTDWEGCLSVPGIRARVPRHHAVEIEFTLLDGRRMKGKLSGFVARIFQHEFDHINGMVFLDRVKDTRTFMTEAQYRLMQRG